MSHRLTLLLAACLAGCTGGDDKATTDATSTPTDGTDSPPDTTTSTVDYPPDWGWTDFTDADTDSDADTDTDADADADADADTDTDTDTTTVIVDSGSTTLTGGDSGATRTTDSGYETCSDGSICPPGDHCAACLSYGPSGPTVVIACIPDGATCGRPHRVDGAPTRSSPAPVAWAPPASPAPHPVAALAWTELALDEHASVAAFARVTLELLALGAPAELLAQTQQAALDEVHHARDAFALASAFAGRPVGPSPLPVQVDLAPDLVSFAVATFVDGCLNETLSTALAAARLDAADEPAVVHALRTVVADETRHAALAWATVAWALREGGAPVRHAVERAWASYRLPTVPERHPIAPHLGVIAADAERRALIACREQVLEVAVAMLLTGASPVGAVEA